MRLSCYGTSNGLPGSRRSQSNAKDFRFELRSVRGSRRGSNRFPSQRTAGWRHSALPEATEIITTAKTIASIIVVAITAETNMATVTATRDTAATGMAATGMAATDMAATGTPATDMANRSVCRGKHVNALWRTAFLAP